MALRRMFRQRTQVSTTKKEPTEDLQERGVVQIEGYKGKKVELWIHQGGVFKCEQVSLDGFGSMGVNLFHEDSDFEILFTKPRKCRLDKWSSTVYDEKP